MYLVYLDDYTPVTRGEQGFERGGRRPEGNGRTSRVLRQYRQGKTISLVVDFLVSAIQFQTILILARLALDLERRKFVIEKT